MIPQNPEAVEGMSFSQSPMERCLHEHQRRTETETPNQTSLFTWNQSGSSISFEGDTFLGFVFFFYSIFNSQLFSSLAEHHIHFAELLRSCGGINGETSGKLNHAGHFTK